MVRFESDYLEGALPEILAALEKTNYEQTPGYGADAYCAAAADMIREKCAAPEAAEFAPPVLKSYRFVL